MNDRRKTRRRQLGVPDWVPESHLPWRMRDLKAIALKLILAGAAVAAIGAGAAYLLLAVIEGRGR